MTKRIGDRVYTHRSAVDTLSLDLQEKVRVAQEAIGDWSYTVVKISLTTDEVSFINAPGFDLEDEPVVISSLKVVAGKPSKPRFESRDNPSIYHGKHLFVSPDYQGFDVAAAKHRYESWKNSGLPEVQVVSRIGRLKYWRDVALPKLRAAGVLP